MQLCDIFWIIVFINFFNKSIYSTTTTHVCIHKRTQLYHIATEDRNKDKSVNLVEFFLYKCTSVVNVSTQIWTRLVSTVPSQWKLTLKVMVYSLNSKVEFFEGPRLIHCKYNFVYNSYLDILHVLVSLICYV
jgi:hypothetical protein